MHHYSVSFQRKMIFQPWLLVRILSKIMNWKPPLQPSSDEAQDVHPSIRWEVVGSSNIQPISFVTMRGCVWGILRNSVVVFCKSVFYDDSVEWSNRASLRKRTWLSKAFWQLVPSFGSYLKKPSWRFFLVPFVFTIDHLLRENHHGKAGSWKSVGKNHILISEFQGVLYPWMTFWVPSWIWLLISLEVHLITLFANVKY